MEPFSAQVLTDEKWFSLILEQVISNAVKYTAQGTVSIYLHNKKTLAIRDTGIGIRKEDLPRVFERGFTGFNGRLDQRATGIGLYLCHEAAAKLGHNLSIQSELGKGTTVFIGIEENELKIF
jgi:signal transduction histidine kinase